MAMTTMWKEKIQMPYWVYKTTLPRGEGIHYSCLREKATFPYTEGGAV